MKRVSTKQAVKNREIKKMKKALYRESPICSGHGGRMGIESLDYSHIIKKGSRPDLYLHPRNGVLECRSCHRIWEEGTMAEKRLLRNFGHRVSVIKDLAPEIYYKRYEGMEFDEPSDLIF